ncbi:MAG TPA: hypothetical protein VGD80_37945 [Kofleriaceae bacterium]
MPLVIPAWMPARFDRGHGLLVELARGRVVADVGRQRGDARPEHRGALRQLVDALLIDLRSGQRLVLETGQIVGFLAAGPGQQRDEHDTTR